MDGLEVRVVTVIGVTSTVISERDDLAHGLDASADRRIAVAVGGELVDVVAEVDDGVEVRAIGEAAIDVEVARRVVRAAHLPEAKALRTAVRKCLGSTDGRLLAGAVKRVVVGRSRLEASGIHLDGEVAFGCRLRRAARDDARHLFVGGDSPSDVERPAVAVSSRRRDSRPEDHAIGQRIAARDTVTKEAGLRPRRSLPSANGQRPRRRRGRGGVKKGATRETHSEWKCTLFLDSKMNGR